MASVRGQYNIDMRVFMMSIAMAMSAAFFAGLTMGPGEVKGLPEWYESLMGTPSSSTPPPAADKKKVSSAAVMQEPDLAGEQIFVDLVGVDKDFLISKDRLEAAMKQTADEAGMSTGWNCRCHEVSDEEDGISCVAFMAKSHMSVHTWPKDSVLTADVFTERDGEVMLFPLAEIIPRHFGGSGDNLRTKWAHQLRALPTARKDKFSIDSTTDLANYIWSQMEMYHKKQLYCNTTKYNRVDVWDWIELDETPSHEDSVKHNLAPDDPRWLSPELVTPERVIFVNGAMEKLSSSDAEIHEGLVHPGMFAHPNPKHVAIVGGIEGGVLREVLKHNTIESVVMINQDEELVQIARKYLPRMSNCSDILDRADDCFEDELATIIYEDPREWFVSRFGADKTKDHHEFDVVIVDDRDPRYEIEFYTDSKFWSAMVSSLSKEGVLVFKTGNAPNLEDPRADKGMYWVREKTINLLEANEALAAMLVYEEPRMGFFDPTAMIMACRDVSCRSRWYARSDQVDFAIYERIVRSKSKQRILFFFDGTTQYAYQAAPKAWEKTYCRREPTPFECAYTQLDMKREIHDLDLDDEDSSSFTVERVRDENDAVVETKVFAKEDIPAGSYIMPEHLASSLIITERNLVGLRENVDVGGGRVSVIEDLLQFIHKHSHESKTEGTNVHFVEVGGSCLIRTVENEDEANVGRWVPPHPSGRRPSFSPVYERHRVSFDVFLVATKNIPKGGEVLRHSSLWKD